MEQQGDFSYVKSESCGAVVLAKSTPRAFSIRVLHQLEDRLLTDISKATIGLSKALKRSQRAV